MYIKLKKNLIGHKEEDFLPNHFFTNNFPKNSNMSDIQSRRATLYASPRTLAVVNDNFYGSTLKQHFQAYEDREEDVFVPQEHATETYKRRLEEEMSKVVDLSSDLVDAIEDVNIYMKREKALKARVIDMAERLRASERRALEAEERAEAAERREIEGHERV